MLELKTYLFRGLVILAVDSLTHALVISIIFGLTGQWDLIPFAIAGAVIPDIDVAFQLFSDRDPGFYIFTHGGITHSLAGAVIASLVISSPGLCVIPALEHAHISPIFGIAAALTGSLSHVLLDYLAYPGIPLLYPFSDRKYTLGIMGGPSVFMTIGSITYIALMATGYASLRDPWPYIGFFIAILLTSAGLKIYVSRKVEGTAIPAMNPMRWLVIRETSDSLLIHWFNLLKGPANPVIYKKATGLEQGVRYEDSPEFRRMMYHSYAVISESEGDKITFRDPVRMDGYIWYPPYFKSVTMSAKKTQARQQIR